MQEHGIPPIDMVVVNLYPFAQTVAKPGCTMEDAIENIDIGGPGDGARGGQEPRLRRGRHRPGRLRRGSLAKMKAQAARSTLAERYALAAKAFSHTAEYDGMISNWLTARDANGKRARLPRPPEPAVAPRAGAALRREPAPDGGVLRRARSARAARSRASGSCRARSSRYNNIADADAAWECCRSFDVPACVIVKHANPCGVAIGATPLEAYRKAFLTDPTSAFGGIIAFNRPVDGADGRGGGEAVRRGGDRARRTTRRRARSSRPSRTCACSRSTLAAGPEPPRHEARGRRACWCRPPTISTWRSCAS